jgi:hypothetical protein
VLVGPCKNLHSLRWWYSCFLTSSDATCLV